jgi:hypothetical protein
MRPGRVRLTIPGGHPQSHLSRLQEDNLRRKPEGMSGTYAFVTLRRETDWATNWP